MDFIAAITAVVVGWQSGRIDRRHLKGIAIVVLGWTAVTTVAGLTYLGLTGLLFVIVYRALLVGLPYAAGVAVRRLQRRRG
uniref:hypothetical protein n=1 Tax=Altererythrobacter segetis TaxID=1104773 RepID=UPI001409A058|nr:hypothetical protein [Altererythrobacter segetis]